MLNGMPTCTQADSSSSAQRPVEVRRVKISTQTARDSLLSVGRIRRINRTARRTRHGALLP